MLPGPGAPSMPPALWLGGKAPWVAPGPRKGLFSRADMDATGGM